MSSNSSDHQNEEEEAKGTKSKSGDSFPPRHSHTFIGSTFAIWSLIFLLFAAFASLQYYLPKAASSCLCPAAEFGRLTAQRAYNDSSFGNPKILPDGRIEYELAVVSDLDHDSKMEDRKETWRSFFRRGRLLFRPDIPSVQVQWAKDKQDNTLYSQLSSGGRAMELSELCVYDGHLLTVDDRTGVVYRMDNFKDMVPWVLLNDGPGNATKGFKGEWMSVRHNLLYVGGLGKEWTSVTGEFINYNPMYVKYKALRGKIGIDFPGYMIHESGQWSDIHKKWFFLPRRASNDTYSETEDEHMGTNLLLIADEDFEHIQVRHIGPPGDGFRGFSAFQFLPNTEDDIIVAIKSEERGGKPIASYLFVFRLSDGHVLLDDQKFDGPYKFEGIVVY
ncbi:hypothetical protein niasHS_005790 [Heterodera schachtii]|uniref:Apyrase n=1 Tax=Heterodera schachtii TaxID=97005 RepID=A0ABD2JZG0_HETSC